MGNKQYWPWFTGFAIGFGGGILFTRYVLKQAAKNPNGLAATVVKQAHSTVREIARSTQRLKEDMEDIIAEANESQNESAPDATSPGESGSEVVNTVETPIQRNE